MIQINRKAALNLIKNSSNFYSVLFEKKDKTLRKMLCRQGVKIGIKGTGRTWNPKEYGFITTYDITKRAFRLININTLKELNINGQKFEIVHK